MLLAPNNLFLTVMTAGAVMAVSSSAISLTRGGHKYKPNTCSSWQLELSTRERGYKPWTHTPYCLPSAGTQEQELCVFTNAEFNDGQGISVVASPDVVRKMVEQDLFKAGASKVLLAKHEAIEKPGLGIGLYVKPLECYKAGEIIMREYPTLIAPSGGVDGISSEDLDMLRWRALLQLPAEARQRTRALARSNTRKDEIIDILDTNAFTHQKGGGKHDIIFPEAARMNHNCIPNAVTRTNETTLAMEVIALRDIYPGEEIAHSYLDPSIELTSYERAARLNSGWDFKCQCSLCSSGKAKLHASNRRRREISRTKESLDNFKGDPANILEHTETLLRLYSEEGMILPKAYYHALAAHACMYLGDNKRAIAYSKNAQSLWDVIFGEDSDESKDMEEFRRSLGKA